MSGLHRHRVIPAVQPRVVDAQLRAPVTAVVANAGCQALRRSVPRFARTGAAARDRRAITPDVEDAIARLQRSAAAVVQVELEAGTFVGIGAKR
jgi:hypothetical protein